MRDVTHDNDHLTNHSYFRDFKTGRTILIGNIMPRERALGIATLRGWRIILWQETHTLQEFKKPGFWKRLLRRK